jgi:DNA-binding NarL/FixJ family response regulator
VKEILEHAFAEVEFGEASNAAEVFVLLKELKWDIILLDIDMPGRNGLEVLNQLKTEHLKIPVLMFSMYPEDQVAIRVLKSGAAGYIQKDAPSSELILAIQLILSGRKYITPSLAEQLALHLENPLNKAPHELLSDREYETTLLFAKGKTVSQIAKELSLSVSTISTFRAHILEKMGMKTTAQLVTYAIRHHLV